MNDRKQAAAMTIRADPVFVERAVTQAYAWPKIGFLASFVLCFVATFGVVWVYVASVPMAFLSGDYSFMAAKNQLLDECRPGVAVFGDSRAMAATIPSVMPINVTNLAMSGSSPIETYFAVQRALECRTPPKLVVIGHSALKFSNDSHYWDVSVRIGSLSFRDMRLIDQDASRLHDMAIRKLRSDDQLPPVLRDMLFALRFPPFYFNSLVHAWVVGRWWNNRRLLSDCLAQSGHALLSRAAGSDAVAEEGDGSTFTALPLIDLYFSRTLALLATHHIQVVLVSIPINHATFVKMNPSLQSGFEAYLRRKAGQFPTVHLLGPAMPCWPDRYFGDAWHLNAEGAEAYSRILGVSLRDELAGKTPAMLPDKCRQT